MRTKPSAVSWGLGGVVAVMLLAGCTEADVQRWEDAVAEARATSPRLFGDEATPRGRGGVSAPGARQVGGRELETMLAGNSVMVEWYHRGDVVEIECGFFDERGRYRAYNYAADDDTYDPVSFVELRGDWWASDDGICVRDSAWGCYDTEWAYDKLQLLDGSTIVANAIVYDGSWEFRSNNCGLL